MTQPTAEGGPAAVPGPEPAGPVPPTGLLPRALATLDPGYFALVMATGIVSIETDLLGYAVLSRVVLVGAIVAFVVLAVAYVARLVRFPAFVRQSVRDPTTAMAYFTLVAGTCVLASRLAMAGHPLVAFGLGAAGALLWLVLTYALPWWIVAAAHRPVLGQMNGTWLVWVVATQSVSVVATLVAPHAPSAWLTADLPVVGVCLWAVGVVLYLILIVIIFLRLLLIDVTPAEMGPAYWIAMGATAISVRAAAGILDLHGATTSPLTVELRPFLIGFSVLLWAFGTWWIPLLVLLGVWRYLVRGYPRTYEPRLWNVVFPLGMYTVASFTLGQAASFGFMVSIARFWVWVGFGAWVSMLALMVAAGVEGVARARRSPPARGVGRGRP